MRQQWEQLLQREDMVLPMLLSADQERVVWQQCQPAALSRMQGVLRHSGLVDHALRANRLFHDWFEPEESLEALQRDTHLDEVELFVEWQQRFEHQCDNQNWLEQARLPHYFAELLAAKCVQLPSQIGLYALSQWNRAQQRLLQRLQALGVSIQSVGSEPLASRRMASVAPDPEAELNAVALAVEAHLQQAPQHHVGVVVPGLAERREAVERVFSRVLVPHTVVEAVSPQQLPYRISAGLPLSQDPRVVHALLLLKWSQGESLTQAELSALLCSPWLLLGDESEARALADLQLRREGWMELTLSQGLRLFTADRSDMLKSAPRFIGALRALAQLELQGGHPSHWWAEHYSRVLAYFEWAENGEQSEEGLVVYDGWREGLDRLVAIGEVVGTLRPEQALNQLRELLSSIELDGGRSSRPVEIVTPDEADGVRFDALWVLSADDHQWPRLQPLSPLLPLSWQRKRIPQATPQGAKVAAQAQLERLGSSAVKVHFSCSEAEEAGGDALRSLTPLLGELQVLPWQSCEQQSWWLPATALEFEEIVDRSVALDGGSAVRGGSGVLADQSQCPFRAFIRHRLQAEPVEQPTSGVNARERGTLLHRLLERIWQQLGRNSAALHQLDQHELEQMVYKLAGGVVEQFRDAHQGRIGPCFAANEQQRLSALAVRALELDRLRKSAFTVEELECPHPIELAGLRFTIKMDRVDQTTEGGRILIDYKSGQVNHADWQGERPAAPQLPLYAILLEQVVAVLYGQIRAQEVCYRGEQQEAAIMEGASGTGRAASVTVSPQWQEQLQQWRQVLEGLAQEFRSGVATIEPLQGRHSCQYCGLQSLCRVSW